MKNKLRARETADSSNLYGRYMHNIQSKKTIIQTTRKNEAETIEKANKIFTMGKLRINLLGLKSSSYPGAQKNSIQFACSLYGEDERLKKKRSMDFKNKIGQNF